MTHLRMFTIQNRSDIKSCIWKTHNLEYVNLKLLDLELISFNKFKYKVI